MMERTYKLYDTDPASYRGLSVGECLELSMVRHGRLPAKRRASWWQLLPGLLALAVIAAGLVLGPPHTWLAGIVLGFAALAFGAWGRQRVFRTPEQLAVDSGRAGHGRQQPETG
jgi:hypothetical protein